MRALGQQQLFMVREGEDDLDRALAVRGYEVADPVIVYACDSAGLGARDIPELAAIPGDGPLAIQREIWAAGGIGPTRLAVMARTGGAACYLLARVDDRPVGTAFVGVDADIAMLHALEVLPEARRRGVGANATIGAAAWAAGCGRIPWR